MSGPARSLVDVYFALSFVEEETAEPEWSLRLSAEIRMAIENDFTPEEQETIRTAASEKLRELLREPDEHGYTPRSLVTPEQEAFLRAISEGRFDGGPA